MASASLCCGGDRHEGHSHLDVMLALAAHMIPMIAVVAMVYQRRGGWRPAVLRVVGLAIATTLGVILTALVPSALYERLEPWVAAVVGGLLLHVVAHDWDTERTPRRLGERVVDLLAMIAGIGLVARRRSRPQAASISAATSRRRSAALARDRAGCSSASRSAR
jgi:uncharacterized membrane protein YfcA